MERHCMGGVVIAMPDYPWHEWHAKLLAALAQFEECPEREPLPGMWEAVRLEMEQA